MLSMIANPVTALPVGYPRSGLSRSDLVRWPFSPFAMVQRYFRSRRLSRHRADIVDLALLTLADVGMRSKSGITP